jgi:hypothetical protein
LIDTNFVVENDLETVPLEQPIFPTLADGKKGVPITHRTTAIQCAVGDHVETISFLVTTLAEHPIFLGMPWLSAHNPSVVWSTGIVRFLSPLCRDHRSTILSERLGAAGQPSLFSPVQVAFDCLLPKDQEGLTRSLRRELVVEFVQSLEWGTLPARLRDTLNAFAEGGIPPDIGMPLNHQPFDVLKVLPSYIEEDTEEAPFPPSGLLEENVEVIRSLGASEEEDWDRYAVEDPSKEYFQAQSSIEFLNIFQMTQPDITHVWYVDDLVDAPHLAGRHASNSDYSALWEQHLDPVHIPPPPDAETLKSQVPSKYHDLLDVFSPRLADRLPDHGPHDFHIDFIEGKENPRKMKPYRQPAHLNKIADDYVADLMKRGYVRESKSPIASPLMFVPKKNSDPPFRPVVDYRAVNSITKRWHYPLPRIEEIFESTHKARFFTRLDLRSAFYLIRIREEDCWKSSFVTTRGQYEYTVMPFGLCNAPSAFQHMIDSVFADMVAFCRPYIDDILIHSETQEEHDEHVRRVLERLRERGLYVKAEKCEFDVQETEFLGHVLANGTVRPSPTKVASILNWRPPTTVLAVQAFMGLINYYRRFIEGYSDVAKPLYRLTEVNRKWEWTDECQAAFEALKTALTTAPVLVQYDPEKPCFIEADASKFAMGAILSQMGDDGLLHPVEFYSRTLTPAELNYDTSDKEMLAIVSALRVWYHLLAFAKHQVTIYSDHRNLQYFMTPRTWNPRQNRWLNDLLEINFKIHWRPGKEMSKADALSRQPALQPDKEAEGTPLRPLLSPNQYEPIPTTDDNWKTHVNAVSIAAEDLEDPQGDTLPYDQYIDDDGHYSPIDPDLSISALVEAQEKDAGIQSIVAYLNRSSKEKPAHVAEDELGLYSLSEDGLLLLGNLCVVPPDDDKIKLKILRRAHNPPSASHPGVQRTADLVGRDFTWRGMTAFVRDYVRGCVTCQSTKRRRHAPYGELQPLRIPSRPYECISIDAITKLPRTKDGNDSIMNFVCRFSKALKSFPFCEAGFRDEDMGAMLLNKVVCDWGLPSEIVTDRASINIQGSHPHLMRMLGCIPLATTAYMSRSNGQVERVNQVIESAIRPYVNTRQDDWDQYIGTSQAAYMSQYQSSIKMSPFKVVNGFDMPTPLSLPTPESDSPRAEERFEELKSVHDQVKTALQAAQLRHSRYFNRRIAQPPPYKVGDRVWLNRRNLARLRPHLKLDVAFYGPFRIIAKTASPLVWRLDLPPHMSLLYPCFHVNLLEPFREGFKNQWQEPPRPILKGQLRSGKSDPDVEYVVERVYDSRIRSGGNPRKYNDYQYLTAWVGYSSEHDLWQDYNDIKNVDKFKDFARANLNNPNHVFPEAVRKELRTLVNTTTPKSGKKPPPTPPQPPRRNMTTRSQASTQHR